MQRYLSIILLILTATAAQAQFNDSTYHRLTLGVSGSINKANGSTAYLLNNSLGFSIKKKDLVINSSNNWIYGKQNSQLTNNDYSSTLNFNLYKTIPHFYYWGWPITTPAIRLRSITNYWQAWVSPTVF